MHDRGASPPRGVAAHPVSRMWRTLVRLALFQTGPEAPRARISPNDTNPSLTWIRCHLLATHERVIRSAPGHVFLECQHCGARSRGWELSPARYAMPRRAAADAVSLIPADPMPATAGVAPDAPALPRLRMARAARARSRRPGRAFLEIRRLVVAPAQTLRAVGVDARALGAPARARMHVSRDPPGACAPLTASRAGRPHANHASFLPTLRHPIAAVPAIRPRRGESPCIRKC